MKSKLKISFVCQECGYDSPSWLGKCPECSSWNSFKELQLVNREAGIKKSGDVAGTVKAQKLQEIASEKTSRIQTNYEELNTVLGGGIVAGSVILIAGDPGVGKSTLLLQLAVGVQHSASLQSKVLYVSGEESVEQVKMRAVRISEHSETQDNQNVGSPKDLKDRGSQSSKFFENLYLVSLANTDIIVQQIEEMKPDLVIVDSIQTIESQNVSGLSGSIGQIRYATLQFVRIAKQYNIPIVIVGHVTKEGMVAGPMVLSHMVDTVLFLEGEKFSKTRILRSLKNRFGPVDEVGIFLMEENGLQEARNPEQLFLESKNITAPGSVLVSTLEGSRAFLVELQALVVTTRLPMPRRVVSGLDPRRIELLLAVLQKHCQLPMDTMDVFVNIAGGLKLSDPGVDLGVCLAVVSSLRNAWFGTIVGIAEVGLLGELRAVNGLEKRVKEAKKLGFKHVITAKTHKTLREVIEELK